MSPKRKSPAIAAGVLGATLAAAGGGACGKSHSSFEEPPDASPGPSFGDDSGPPCGLQCSLDGRSVIRTCTGEVAETCSPDKACGAGACQEPCAAAAADRRSDGCDFYLQPPLFTKDEGRGCYAAYVVNTSAVPVNVSMELQGQPIDVSKSMYRMHYGDGTLVSHTGPIAAGEGIILFVFDRPNDFTGVATHCPKGIVAATSTDPTPARTGFGSSFHLTTNVPINLSAIYPFGGALSHLPSATLLLPVPTWGREHIIVNAWERMTSGAFTYTPSAHIVASEDDTDVTIYPNHDIQDGRNFVGTPAHVPATYHLNKGQLLQIDQAEELSGSFVTSNKPTSVYGGHECMYIPSARTACDTALQQLPSFEQWGSEYVGVGYRGRIQGDESERMPYRIVAAKDDTHLDYDPAVPPGAPVTLSAGQVVTFWAGVGQAFVVRTQDVDHPIYLSGGMSGAGPPSGSHPDILGDQFIDTGDPEFVNIVPAGQYLNSYSFFADPTYDETSLVIVRAKTGDEFKDVWLECAGNLTGFKPVGTRGQYEYVKVDLSRKGGPGQAFDGGVCNFGLQRMHSDGPFTATVWGWAWCASYAYPGGMAQRKLVTGPLTPPR